MTDPVREAAAETARSLEIISTRPGCDPGVMLAAMNLRAALAAAPERGAPNLPTAEMIEAGMREAYPHLTGIQPGDVVRMWQAMMIARPLAAAPAQPDDGDGCRPQNQFSTAGEPAQQEQHDDDNGAGSDRGQQGVRSVSVERAGQAAGIPGDGQAGGVRDPVHQRGAECGRAGGRGFPLLIDNDTLRKQIAADPDDEPSAGFARPAP